MSSTLRRVLVAVAVLAGAGLILFFGTSALARGGGPLGWPNGMGGNSANQAVPWTGGMMGYHQGALYNGRGMMGGNGMMSYGANMMNGVTSYTGTLPAGMGAMMGYSGTLPSGMGTMMGFGSGALLGAKPLSVEQATSAVNGYLSKLGNADLTLAEVMIFDNNAYARVTEKSTGAGAFELLVNPVTLAVTPEPGPNMMWNTKYSPMRGAMAGMMGFPAREVTTAMPVSAAGALKAAQTYLDQSLPGAKTAEDADTFYGYYTIDILRDGKVAGMLGVNGYTAQVFLHTWHGNFITLSEGGR